jgi:hypothetical protein
LGADGPLRRIKIALAMSNVVTATNSARRVETIFLT